MVRRRAARGLKLGERAVCMNVSGSQWRIALRPFDDDPRVLVLTSRTVTVDLSRKQILRYPVKLFSRLLLSSADRGGSVFRRRRGGGGNHTIKAASPTERPLGFLRKRCLKALQSNGLGVS